VFNPSRKLDPSPSLSLVRASTAPFDLTLHSVYGQATDDIGALLGSVLPSATPAFVTRDSRPLPQDGRMFWANFPAGDTRNNTRPDGQDGAPLGCCIAALDIGSRISDALSHIAALVQRLGHCRLQLICCGGPNDVPAHVLSGALAETGNIDRGRLPAGMDITAVTAEEAMPVLMTSAQMQGVYIFVGAGRQHMAHACLERASAGGPYAYLDIATGAVGAAAAAIVHTRRSLGRSALHSSDQSSGAQSSIGDGAGAPETPEAPALIAAVVLGLLERGMSAGTNSDRSGSNHSSTHCRAHSGADRIWNAYLALTEKGIRTDRAADLLPFARRLSVSDFLRLLTAELGADPMRADLGLSLPLSATKPAAPALTLV